MDSLALASFVFVLSATFVVLGGIGLARFGDEIAEATGWGKLWVGTLLVGIATSLPEVVVNVSSVWLEENPGLALGNVFGANMINLFVLGTVALIFGVQNLFGNQGRDTEVLIATGLGLVTLALLFGAFGDIALGPVGLGALLIGVGYIYGMRQVYTAGREHMALTDIPAPTGNARRAWIGFGISALVVIVAGRYLAASADAIAEASGISATFIGVLLVSLVTTLPEGTVTVTASLRRSYGIAMGNVYGSCAFNMAVILIADLFHGPEPLLREMQPAHFAAGIAAFTLMGLGYLVFKAFHSAGFARARVVAPAIPVLYVAALFVVYTLGQAAP
jgi:cation:H+ antiporter